MGNLYSNPEDNSKKEPNEEDHCKELREQLKEEKEKQQEHKKELQEAKKEHKQEYKDACRHERELYKEGKHNLHQGIHHGGHHGDLQVTEENRVCKNLQRYVCEENFKKDINHTDHDKKSETSIGKGNTSKEQRRREKEKIHETKQEHDGKRIDEKIHGRHSQESSSSVSKNLPHRQKHNKHAEKSKTLPSTSHNQHVIHEQDASECLTEVDREFLKLLTEEEKQKYLHERNLGTRKGQHRRKKEKIHETKQDHDGKRIDEKSRGRHSRASSSSASKNLPHMQGHKYAEKSKNHPSTSKTPHNIHEQDESECLTDEDRKSFKLLTEEEKQKYLYERNARKEQRRREKEKIHEAKQEHDAHSKRINEKSHRQASTSSASKNLPHMQEHNQHVENSKTLPSTGKSQHNIQEQECLTEMDREFLKLLTEDEKVKYLHERKKLYEERQEHIRKIKEEHQKWKVHQHEEHEEFKRRQKEEHQKWKEKQHEEHEEFKKKHKQEHDEAKKKLKEEKRKRKQKKDDSESSSDSSSEEEHKHGLHHLFHHDHHRHPHLRHHRETGLVSNARHMANHLACQLYRTSGARSAWKFVKKKIIKKVIRRTYRKVKRACYNFLNLVFSEDGLPFIILFIAILLGSYLLWRYALTDRDSDTAE